MSAHRCNSVNLVLKETTSLAGDFNLQMTCTNKSVPVRHSYTVFWHIPSPKCRFIGDLYPFLHWCDLWERRVSKIMLCTKCFQLSIQLRPELEEYLTASYLCGRYKYLHECILLLTLLHLYVWLIGRCSGGQCGSGTKKCCKINSAVLCSLPYNPSS